MNRIVQAANGFFDVYVKSQDGNEHCGKRPTLPQAVELYYESQKSINHNEREQAPEPVVEIGSKTKWLSYFNIETKNDSDLIGKVCVCKQGRVGVVVGKTYDEMWYGIGFDGKGFWSSHNPVVLHDSLVAYAQELKK